MVSLEDRHSPRVSTPSLPLPLDLHRGRVACTFASPKSFLGARILHGISSALLARGFDSRIQHDKEEPLTLVRDFRPTTPRQVYTSTAQLLFCRALRGILSSDRGAGETRQ